MLRQLVPEVARHPPKRGAPLLRWQPLAAALVLACAAGAAQAGVHWSLGLNLGFPVGSAYGYGPYGYGYGQPYGYGNVVSALPAGSVSVQVGGGRYWRHGGYWYRPWGPSFILTAPPVVLAQPPSQLLPAETVYAAPLPAAPSRPDPVIYPRNGQDAERTEIDRQECNRWATTQPAALADAAVFHRAVEACMDGRGYTMK